MCEGRGKPLDVPPTSTYTINIPGTFSTLPVPGGLGERVRERPHEVLLEHIRGLVEDVAELKKHVVGMQNSQQSIRWCKFHQSYEHGGPWHEEPDYMPGDFKPGR